MCLWLVCVVWVCGGVGVCRLANVRVGVEPQGMAGSPGVWGHVGSGVCVHLAHNVSMPLCPRHSWWVEAGWGWAGPTPGGSVRASSPDLCPGELGDPQTGHGGKGSRHVQPSMPNQTTCLSNNTKQVQFWTFQKDWKETGKHSCFPTTKKSPKTDPTHKRQSNLRAVIRDGIGNTRVTPVGYMVAEVCNATNTAVLTTQKNTSKALKSAKAFSTVGVSKLGLDFCHFTFRTQGWQNSTSRNAMECQNCTKGHVIHGRAPQVASKGTSGFQSPPPVFHLIHMINKEGWPLL